MTIKTYLDHLPEKKQHELAAIRDVILNSVDDAVQLSEVKKKDYKVIHIILFGSHAKGGYVDDPASGYISDYDILVVVNVPDMVNDTTLWRRIEDKVERHVKSPTNFIIHTAAEVDVWLREGQYFFSDIQSEGIYLYNRKPNGKGLPEPKHLTNQERKPIAEKHFEQWFTSANNFFEGYGFYIGKGFLKEAAFQLHQTTERYFATLLLVASNYRPKTHNLKLLRSIAIQLDIRMASIFPQDTRYSRRCFDLLKRAYIDSRYSEHYKVTEEELSWLADQVMLLKQEVESICVAHIEALGNS
jgi:uncharacterized protein